MIFTTSKLTLTLTTLNIIKIWQYIIMNHGSAALTHTYYTLLREPARHDKNIYSVLSPAKLPLWHEPCNETTFDTITLPALSRYSWVYSRIIFKFVTYILSTCRWDVVTSNREMRTHTVILCHMWHVMMSHKCLTHHTSHNSINSETLIFDCGFYQWKSKELKIIFCSSNLTQLLFYIPSNRYWAPNWGISLVSIVSLRSVNTRKFNWS